MSFRYRPPRVALITTHGLTGMGGTARWTKFLYEAQARVGRYDVEVISIASSSRDATSRRLLSPTTWVRKPKIESSSFLNIPFRHVGAEAVELEFQRYRPREPLTGLLKTYDVLQFVVGFASWGCVAEGSNRPVVLWTGTTSWPDRASRVQKSPPLRRAWLTGMNWIAEHFERRALKQAVSVLVPSEYTMKAVRLWTQPGRMKLAFCGVDTEMFCPDPSVPREGILTVGRFSDARKNLPLLLHAYAQLVQRLPRVPELRVVGELLPGACVLAQRLGISGRVRFLGTVSDAELAHLYKSSEIYVLPSDEEGLSNVIQEAMASGLPVVSTQCGGPPTIVRHGVTGLLTPVGDAPAMATAIHSLLEDSNVRKCMGEAAREFAEKRFSLDVAASVFFDCWDAAIEEMSQSAACS